MKATLFFITMAFGIVSATRHMKSTPPSLKICKGSIASGWSLQTVTLPEWRSMMYANCSITTGVKYAPMGCSNKDVSCATPWQGNGTGPGPLASGNVQACQWSAHKAGEDGKDALYHNDDVFQMIEMSSESWCDVSHKYCSITPGYRYACPDLASSCSNPFKINDTSSLKAACGIVDCKLSDTWYNVTTCNKSTGLQTQTQKVVVKAVNGGAPCKVETRTVACPVNCVVSSWVNTTACNTTTGRFSVYRNITTAPLNGGRPCPSSLSGTINCPVDCVLSNDWTNSGSCDPTTGLQHQVKTVLVTSKNGGAACPSPLPSQDICCGSDCAVLITPDGNAYGHHGECSGWNACGDAATCAKLACEAEGYTTLVSFGTTAPCTSFSNCNLMYCGSQGCDVLDNEPCNGIQYNWGNWCDVMGVGEIYCSDKTFTCPANNLMQIYQRAAAFVATAHHP